MARDGHDRVAVRGGRDRVPGGARRDARLRDDHEIEGAMAVTTPYTFDTRGITLTLLRAALGFELVVVVPGILYSLTLSNDLLVAALLTFVGAFVAVIGVLIAKVV